MSDEIDRVGQLEDRVADLERRLERLASLSSAPRPTTAPVPRPATAAGPAASATRPAAAPQSAAAPRPAAAPSPAAQASTPPRPGLSLAELEERLSGRLLAWAGGVALLLGAVFFLSLAFNRGWIGPDARVLIGLAASAAALGLGAWLFDRGQGTPALVLVAVGVAVGMLALFSATELYGFIAPEIGLLAALILAIGAAAIAVRADSQVVAALGLLAVLGAPPVLGASANLFAVAFLGAALVGTTAIAVWRSWPWLPALALLVTAPQLARWLGDQQPVALATVVVAAYWLVNAVGAAGDTLSAKRRQLHRSSAMALVANALFTIAALHGVLNDESPLVRTGALVLLAGAHLVLAAPLLRATPRHPFGWLAAGVAAGTLTIAVALEFGGIYQPIAWTALAVGLAGVAVALRDRPAAVAAAVPALLALDHFTRHEYPLSQLDDRTLTSGVPFASPEGIVLATLLAGVWVAAFLGMRAVAVGRLSPGHGVTPARVAVAGVLASIALVAWAAPFELSFAGAVVTWAALAGVAFGVGRGVRVDRLAHAGAFAGGLTVVALGALVVLGSLAPPDRLFVDPTLPAAIVPFINDETAAMLALVAALAAAAITAPRRTWAGWATAAGGTMAVYLASVGIADSFQAQVGEATSSDLGLQAQVALSIAWVLAGAAAFAVGLARGIPVARAFGLALLAVATAKVFLFDLAALDVAYRVLSFIGLGIVLLASAFLATRLRGAAPARAPENGESQAA